jgi:hypothetical protein
VHEYANLTINGDSHAHGPNKNPNPNPQTHGDAYANQETSNRRTHCQSNCHIDTDSNIADLHSTTGIVFWFAVL